MTDQSVLTDDAIAPPHPAVRKISISDLKDVLSGGFEDFRAAPTQVIFLCVIYPIIGAILARAAAGYAMLPLLYPLMTGFALIGPFAALGLYELSRRREQGLPVSWTDAFGVLRSPSRFPIAVLGLLLVGVFLTWLDAAEAIYTAIFGNTRPASLNEFLHQVLATESGLTLFLLGNFVGFLFAAVVLTLTVVSFPLLLDRKVGPVVAVLTSVRAVIANPLPMAVWGLIVAAGLLIGALPFFIGLAIVLPILGHATWRLYRKVVV